MTPRKKIVRDSVIRIDTTDGEFSRARILGATERLTPFVRFKVPHARFTPAYKSRRWDGNISLVKYNKIPVGLVPYLVEKTKDFTDLQWELYHEGRLISPGEFFDRFFKGPPVDPAIVDEVMGWIPTKYIPRDYQLDSIVQAFDFQRAMVYLATGGGKSLILYLLARILMESVGGPGLIIVPRIMLAEQMDMNIDLYSGGRSSASVSVEGRDQVLSSAHDENQLIVSTFQSWMTWYDDGEKLPDLKFIVGDEAHTYGGQGAKGGAKVKGGVNKYMDVFGKVQYRYGLTATPPDQELDKLSLEGLFGPAMYIKKAESLIEEGYLARPEIHRIFLKHELGEEEQHALDLHLHDFTLQQNKLVEEMELTRQSIVENLDPAFRRLARNRITEIEDEQGRLRARITLATKDFLLIRPSRLDFIRDLILGSSGEKEAYLILAEKVIKHLIPMSEYLSSAGINMLNLDKDSKRDERAKAVSTMADPENITALGVTYGLFQMGVDIPTLSNIILFAPSSSTVRVLQSIGRGLRPQSRCRVFDLIDYIDTPPKSAQTRKKIYDKEYGDQYDLEEHHLILG